MAPADPSLEKILRDHSALAQRLASSHEANPDLARDLAQEILVAVWRAWPAFRKQCSERTYVARIAHNRIATHIIAFEGDSHVEFYQGNYREYEEDKRRRLGEEGAKPHRLRYKALK